MGREIRRVPSDWEHPRYTKENANRTQDIGSYMAIHDQDYQSACEEWYQKAASFQPIGESQWYHEYEGNPPSWDSYRERRWTPEEATHYQVYETVTEGTPLTPVFGSKEELIEYLVKHGTFWDQKDGRGGWGRKAAEQFVGSGYAPSLVVRMLRRICQDMGTSRWGAGGPLKGDRLTFLDSVW